MKKYIISLIIGIIAIFSFNINLKAETCNYTYIEPYSLKDINLKFDVTKSGTGRRQIYNFSYDGVSLIEWNTQDSTDEHQKYYMDNHYYLLSSPRSFTLQYDSYNQELACPNIYINDVIISSDVSNGILKRFNNKDTNGNVNIRVICSTASGHCENSNLIKAKETLQQEAKHDINYGNDSTTYVLGSIAGDAFGCLSKTSVTNESAYNKPIVIYITAYNTMDPNARFKIKINEEVSNPQDGYVSSHVIVDSSLNALWSTTISLRINNISTVTGQFILKESDYISFVNAFPYVPGESRIEASNLTISTISDTSHGSKKIYALSVGESSNTLSKCESNASNTNATTTTVEDKEKYTETAGYRLNSTIAKFNYETDTCENILGEELVSILQAIFDVIKVVSVVLLIVFSMIDFASSATSSKEDVMKKVNKWVKRLIILLIILLLPTLINIIGGLIGFENILCGIG